MNSSHIGLCAQKVIASDTFVTKVAGCQLQNVGEYSFAQFFWASFFEFVRSIRIPAPKGAKSL